MGVEVGGALIGGVADAEATSAGDGDDAATFGSLVRASRRRTPAKTAEMETSRTAIEIAIERRMRIICMTRDGRQMLRGYPSL
ncbi:MAG: hypothetical protein M3O64_02150 [Chloroflexota bacterium]|nr:hypothetical protein [Chloroflexota bacterium]